MTANELCRACGFTLLAGGGREIKGGVYCCDLLSMVMGRAPTDGVWFTVMANQNTIVAALMARLWSIMRKAHCSRTCSFAELAWPTEFWLC